MRKLRQLDYGQRLRRGQGLWHEELCRHPAADEVLALRSEGSVANDPLAAAASWMMGPPRSAGSPLREFVIVGVGEPLPIGIELELLGLERATRCFLALAKRGFLLLE